MSVLCLFAAFFHKLCAAGMLCGARTCFRPTPRTMLRSLSPRRSWTTTGRAGARERGSRDRGPRLR